MLRRLIGVLILIGVAVTAWVAAVPVGSGPGGPPELVWGTRGVRPGDLARPRAATIDRDGRLWVVDFTARVQAYDLDGNHLGITFTTPDFRNGRPSGLGTDNRGRLIVCDSHYHCVRVYETVAGEEVQVGSKPGSGVRGPGSSVEEADVRAAGHSPGVLEVLLLPSPPASHTSPLLSYVSDCVQDEDGFWYVSEFGERDRVTKLDSDGKPIATWGESGAGPGQFNRARALALGPDGLLYVADACNHRVQVFGRDGRFVRAFGGPGSAPGRFSYPYDLAFEPGGDLYVVERGNNRVQKLTAEGQPLAVWGTGGRGPGQLSDPWALAVDRFGRVHVIDTENHRVQRVRF